MLTLARIIERSAVVLFLCTGVSHAATITVTNAGPGGPGTLAEALQTAATTSPAPTTIQFSLPGAPPYVIAPTSGFSALYSSVTVDGTTQPGYSNNTPLVIVDGGNLTNADCFEINGSDNLVRGLRIQNFGRAVYLYTLSSGGQSNRIEACHIISNSEGIVIYPSSNNVIGGLSASNRNVISGNTNNGVLVEFTSGNLIAGNWIGVHPTNSAIALSNRYEGIWLFNSQSNVISGTSSRQVIAGNGDMGIRIDASSNNVVVGNYIGCDASGSVAVPNAAYGVDLQYSSGNTIGGTAAASRNVISGNLWGGVDMTGAGSYGNVVQGNYIGVSAAGAPAIPNLNGVVVQSGAANNAIGGAAAGAGNVVSGNLGDGIDIYGASNVVRGNLVGLSVGGLVVSNGNDGIGVTLSESTLVGGTAAGAGNTVGGNGGDGIRLDGNGTTVQGNLIGLDANGFRKANRLNGIHCQYGGSNVIGGTSAAARNVISANGQNGVLIDTGSSYNLLQGNYIGVDSSGTAALSNNVSGVRIASATNNTIGGSTAAARNVISGNGGNQIDLQALAKSNTIAGNFIGLAANGATMLPNGLGYAGISLGGEGNTVGGTTPGERNVIGGNASHGVYAYACTNNVIFGNYIGLASNGVTVASNGLYDVRLDVGARRVMVDGSVAGAGNVIAGSYYGVYVNNCASNFILGNSIGLTATGNATVTNTSYAVHMLDAAYNSIAGGNVIFSRVVGVTLQSTNTHHNVIQGNFLNLNAAGNIVSSNCGTAFVVSDAPSNTIGGIGSAVRNLITANGNGIELLGTNTVGTVVQGNYFSVGPDGFSPRALTNVAGGGVLIQFASRNLIGGTNAGAGNIIAYRTTGGISIFGTNATGNAILGNSIYSNGTLTTLDLAIDLNANGLTGNDAVPDSDLGANNLQNFPIITNAIAWNGSCRLQGYLASVPSRTYRLEFFGADANFPEGKRYLGATSIATAASGTGSFSVVLSGSPGVLQQYITATATDASNNTSELAFPLGRATAAADSDSDGMPDYWETLFGLNPGNPADASTDLDGDHVNNLQEYLADTIPTNGASFLAIDSLAVDGTNAIAFPTSPFRNYALDSGTDLAAGTWAIVVTNALGDGLEMTLLDRNPLTRANYRVRAIVP